MWVSDLVRKYGLEEEKFNDFVVNDPRINATYLSHNNTMDVLISAPAEADVMNMYNERRSRYRPRRPAGR